MSNNNPSTCKKCTSKNFRQIGELSHDEWLRLVNNQGWKGGRGGWIHAQSHTTMSHNAMMEFFRVGDTPYPPAWDEVDNDRLLVWGRCVPGKWSKGADGTQVFTPDEARVNVVAGITGELKDESTM